ncbi:MAG TPA: exosortase A [Terriglobales bacterium]|nr:exosortase A [Terriglobales bacterium]
MVPRVSAWKATLVGGLLLWLYYPVVVRLVLQWWHDPNFSHGFFVPIFSGYVLWLNRRNLRNLPSSPSWYGVVILLAGLSLLILGSLGAELFLSRFSILLVSAGLVISFLGWSFQRRILFPWMILLLMIPIPAIIFNQITFPLQLIASKAATATLQLIGIPALRDGNVIQIPAMALEVAEACSGIRSLLSLTTLTIIYGYLMETSVGMRVGLALASVPIAIFANSLRIVGTGLTVQYWDPNRAEGFFHAFSGWLIFVVSLSMLFALHKILRTLWPRKVVA